MEKNAPRVQVRFDRETYEGLQRSAHAQKITVSELIRSHVEYCLTNDAYANNAGELDQMIRAATRDASAYQANQQREFLTKQALSSATSMFLVLEVVAEAFGWGPEESRRFYELCQDKAVQFVSGTVRPPEQSS